MRKLSKEKQELFFNISQEKFDELLKKYTRLSKFELMEFLGFPEIAKLSNKSEILRQYCIYHPKDLEFKKSSDVQNRRIYYDCYPNDPDAKQILTILFDLIIIKDILMIQMLWMIQIQRFGKFIIEIFVNLHIMKNYFKN